LYNRGQNIKVIKPKVVTGVKNSSKPKPATKQPVVVSTNEPVLLSCSQLMDKILAALEAKRPLAVVSMGATEAFVMAQYDIYPEAEFMLHREATIANMGVTSGFLHRGIRFPNRKARDEAVEAVRKADIVGYNTLVSEPRFMAEKVLQTYDLRPSYIFEANLRRVFMFSQREKFEQMLAGRRLLLISALAAEVKAELEKELASQLGLNIVGAISIYEYEDIPRVKRQLDNYDFDLCFLAAGVNALILAPYIAEKYGKVAFDIGSAMQSLITGYVVTDSWIAEDIGIASLFQM